MSICKCWICWLVCSPASCTWTRLCHALWARSLAGAWTWVCAHASAAQSSAGTWARLKPFKSHRPRFQYVSSLWQYVRETERSISAVFGQQIATLACAKLFRLPQDFTPALANLCDAPVRTSLRNTSRSLNFSLKLVPLASCILFIIRLTTHTAEPKVSVLTNLALNRRATIRATLIDSRFAIA